MTTASERPRVIGRQLRSARELLGLSHKDAARELRVTEDQVRRWESDVDEPGVEKLWDLAALYKRSPDYFLKATPETPSRIDYRLTARDSLDQMSRETREAIARFEELCRWQSEVEELVGEERPAHLPKPQESVGSDDAARAERERLGLGHAPVPDIRNLLEGQGVRVFELPVPGGEFAGFSWWNADLGPCVLVNAADDTGRRNFTLAHEYAHLLRRREATICDLTRDDSEEVFANQFAAAFLLPEEDVRRVASEKGLVGTVPGAAELAPLANRYHVSLEAAGRRLEGLGLVPRGSTDARRSEWQAYRPFRRRARRPGWRRRLGEPFVRTAFTAYSRGVISLSKLAQLLDLDVRKVRDTYEQEARELDME